MNEYKISTQTIKDIINNIPEDKWDTVFDEMKVAAMQINVVIKGVRAVLGGFAESNGEEKIDFAKVVGFPDEITWKDDGLATNTINIRDGESGENLGSFEFDCGSEK